MFSSHTEKSVWEPMISMLYQKVVQLLHIIFFNSVSDILEVGSYLSM